jgi:hypothetical protein
MDLYLIIFMALATVVVFLFIFKKIWYNSTYYKTQYIAIMARMGDFKNSFKGVRHDKIKKQIEYKQKDILTDLISFKMVLENIDYKSKNQKVYLKKLKQLLYIDLISFTLCFNEKYKNRDISKLYKEKKFKELQEFIEIDIIDPIIAQYEVYTEIKNTKNSMDKEILMLMQNIERKTKKQKEKIFGEFKKT